ncbi:hypothetical protein [Catenuloplanes atrovinosus]|uniref:Bulb-type lectin domain-containing protein n=1 Tax=Catenuloplanes atrovinosus TaxID=137266 RepID=A0AAE3YND9_9ACTN|nr:hypothetical protein [Catenuloplanes atrovinosus]MDR7277013.1 hypothetical protein [Catenuloplanes atrovinosus]
MNGLWRSMMAACGIGAVVIGLGVAAPGPAGAQAVAPVTFSNWDVGIGGPGQGPDPAGKPVRIEMSWWAVQDDPGDPYDWTEYDEVVARAEAAGQKILVLITYAPPWANGGHTLADGLDHWFPLPEWDAEWDEFVVALTRRYAGRVWAYEIWNEPNHAAFGNYGGGTDLERKTRYWTLADRTYSLIKDECEACTVLAGGSAAGTRPANQPAIPDSVPNPNSPAEWLTFYYANDFGDAFDAVAHHPYPIWHQRQGPSQSDCARPDRVLYGPSYQPGKPYHRQCGQLAALRAVLVDHGEGHKKIWGTEWGYPTKSGMGASHPSLELIRDFEVEGVHRWRETDYLGPLFLYQYRDSAGCTDADVNPECHYGIVRRDGTRKEPRYSELAKKVANHMPASLTTGESIRAYSALRSPNGRFHLWMQGDGNLVLYDSSTGRALWSVVNKGARRLLVQPDGNLVLYKNADTPVAVWSSQTPTAGRATLWMQDDGNLVLYRDDTGRPVWASNTVVS